MCRDILALDDYSAIMGRGAGSSSSDQFDVCLQEYNKLLDRVNEAKTETEKALQSIRTNEEDLDSTLDTLRGTEPAGQQVALLAATIISITGAGALKPMVSAQSELFWYQKQTQKSCPDPHYEQLLLIIQLQPRNQNLFCPSVPTIFRPVFLEPFLWLSSNIYFIFFT